MDIVWSNLILVTIRTERINLSLFHFLFSVISDFCIEKSKCRCRYLRLKISLQKYFSGGRLKSKWYCVHMSSKTKKINACKKNI